MAKPTRPPASPAAPAAAPAEMAVEGKTFGIGASGDVGFNEVVETTEAFLSGTGAITVGAALAVTAADGATFVGGGRRPSPTATTSGSAGRLFSII